MPNDTALSTALHVLRHWPGTRILPVNGKVPAYREVPRGSLDASDDPKVVAGWFSGTDYGVAVTGVLAIDCDDPDKAFDTFGDDLSQGVMLSGNPDRFTALFAQPEAPYGDGAHPGGEVKGSGYVVLPPSRHQSEECLLCKTATHEYLWLGGLPKELPPLPASIVTWLDSYVRRQSEHHDPADEVPPLWLTLGTPCLPVVRQVQEAVAALAEPKVAKHPIMTGAVMRLLRLGEQGHAGVRDGFVEVWEAFHAACLAESNERGRVAAREYQRAALGAVALIEEKPTPGEEYGCCIPGHDPEQDDRVFNATPLLQHIREQAQYRMVGPWSVLGSTLARAVAEVPPHVRLPGFVGGDASLNLYVALVDDSGSGKSSSHKAADEVFPEMNWAWRVPNGTGEGLIQSFLEATTKDDRAADPTLGPTRLRTPAQVLMYVDEIGQLAIGSSRSTGASIDPILRSMWNGEHVGTNNADASRNRDLPPHQYRLSLVAGVQPKLAGALLNGAALSSGTAQRWVWLPTMDPTARIDAPPPAVPYFRWEGPNTVGGVLYIEYPEYVRDEVRALRLITLRGEATEADSIRAHQMLTRMKVAAALAVLHGTLEVDDLFWRISGDIIAKSDTTRGTVLATLAASATAEAEARGASDAARDRGKARTVQDAIKGPAASLARAVFKHGTEGTPRHNVDAGCVRACLAQAVAGKDRHLLPQAIDYAMEEDWIVLEGERFRTGGSRPA